MQLTAGGWRTVSRRYAALVPPCWDPAVGADGLYAPADDRERDIWAGREKIIRISSWERSGSYRSETTASINRVLPASLRPVNGCAASPSAVK